MVNVHVIDPNGFMRLRRERTQIEPAGVTGGKSFSGSNTLLKKFVREYNAGIAIVVLTIILDRLSQKLGRLGSEVL